ncbi:MAG: bifunctional diaminohydroxyphosphoribosylaminopyrimidine deaminase/5-amino-6-(5-phosphoribosylamino)uracil reductase RibD [Rubrobacter sp.]
MQRDSFMGLARDLAERGRYTASPNPLVGAVVVRDGVVVGEGWHVRPGELHAEAMALRDAGDSAKGATMYVTLEPCNHHHYSPGPPCSEAIVASDISKVVVGHLDPNPWMNGRSITMLRGAGIEVEVMDEGDFEAQNERFFWHKRTGRPFVHLKLAATLDGRIATASGDSKWVTGSESRAEVHRMRAEAGAVLVGAGTARADDPSLTARDVTQEPPEIRRIILDPKITLPPEGTLARTAGELPVCLFTDEELLDGRESELLRAGVEVVGVTVRGGLLDLGSVLDALGLRDVSGILIEGGGTTAAHFIEGGYVNKLTVFYAPKVVGATGLAMVGDLGVGAMSEAAGFHISEVRRFGEDVAVTYYPKESDVRAGNTLNTRESNGKREGEDVHRVG